MSGLRIAALLMVALGLGGCASFQGLSDALSRRPAVAKDGAPARLVAAYELEIDAPAALRTLLYEHLDLARFRNTAEDERLSPVELDRLSAAAPEQARELLETAGYFNAKVAMQRQGDAQLQRLRMTVDTGPQVQVSAVQLDFAGALAEPAGAALRQRLASSWTLPVGAAYQQAAWSEAKNGLLNLARTEGYALARWASSRALVRTETNAAELALTLESGPLLRLGALSIEGLKHQPASSIERLAGYREGDPYSAKALLDFQERLIKTGLFDSIAVEIKPEAETAAATPVLVTVREAARQQATASLGYHSSHGPRVGLEHLHRRPFDLDLRARSKIELGRDRSALELELTSHPQTDMERNLAAFAVERDQLIANQTKLNWRARLGRQRETENNDRSHYLEWLRSDERFPGNEVHGSAISLNLDRRWRQVDSIVVPTQGLTAQWLLGLGRADNSVARNGWFGKLHAKVFWYQRLGANWTSTLRTELGQLLAGDAVGLPDALRFRAGGDDSVRGYAPEHLGPQDALGNQVGGRVLWTGSAELAHPLSQQLPSLLGAVFVDAGQAAMHWNELRPTLGYGLGLRLRSPVGVLRVDLARAQALGSWRLHFSVGIAL
ncbi:autotransporter assembly complex protein TamA [Paucibacter soli]|uniref:autotransporter assembly complex protein TamA n=1 Tax=Paucibacter soli TaxID=3133433 RepID=UPI0030AB1771